jgi:hypothetical protein
MESYALKIKLGKVTRRVSLNATETSFASLKETLKRLFSTELTTDSFIVKYKDDENDLITVRFDLYVQIRKFTLLSESYKIVN